MRYNVREMMNEDKGITIADYRKLAEIRHHIRRFLHFSEQADRIAGLEPQQHQALLALKGLPEGRLATIGELAERLQIHHNSAVELATRMEERGFIFRSRDEADQRRVILHLTAQGEEVLYQLSRLHYRELQSAAPALVQALEVFVNEDNEDKTNYLDDADGTYQQNIE